MKHFSSLPLSATFVISVSSAYQSKIEVFPMLRAPVKALSSSANVIRDAKYSTKDALYVPSMNLRIGNFYW
jgi:hypothetical protein